MADGGESLGEWRSPFDKGDGWPVAESYLSDTPKGVEFPKGASIWIPRR